MKKLWIIVCVFVMMTSTMSFTILADDGGDMGTNGGISEGKNLPYTMDKYVSSGIKPTTLFTYTEVLFLTGVPIVCKGTITVVKPVVDYSKKPTGTYTEAYTIKAENEAAGVSFTRALTFLTSYRVIEGEFKKQINRNSVMTKWTESITTDGTVYKLDQASSSYSKGSIEDLTPGVSYYNSNISFIANYTTTDSTSLQIAVDGQIYGYSQPWSKVESQDLNMKISEDEGLTSNLEVHIKPFFEAKKTLYYDETDPFPISFAGTYNQRLERES
ncbi:MAG: hypothetical protein H7X94_13740, partial [Vallitaleaceae bacterium]|nr:hypothetical protein [Vallitaleaceae bacterium]